MSTPREAERTFDELAWMLGPGVIVSLYAYADESGIHDAANATVIAGWVSPIKKWKKFSKQWQAALNKHYAPYLHMKELSDYERNNNAASPFYSWKRARVDSLVNDLIPIARDNAQFGMISCVSKAGYDSLTPLMKMGYPHPYVFVFRLFYEELLKALTGNTKMGEILPAGEKCHLVLDQQGEYDQHAYQAFQDLKKERPDGDKFGNMGFAESRGQDAALPLQAADLLANRFYKAHEAEIIRNESPFKPGAWTDRLRSKGNLFITYMDKQACLDFLRRVQRHYGN